MVKPVENRSFLDRLIKGGEEAIKGFQAKNEVGFLSRVENAAYRASMGFFAPVGGGYATARGNNPTAGWQNVHRSQLTSLTADEEILPDLQLMREQTRDLYKNSAIGRGALKRMVSGVIGPGLRFQSNIDADYLGLSDEEVDAWEDRVERRFNAWAESTMCDVECKRNFYEMQKLAYLSALQSGDSIVVLPVIPTAQDSSPHLRLQLIEADQLMNPLGALDTFQFRGGIELDGNRAPIRYHIRNDNFQWRAVDAYGKQSGRKQVIHLLECERPGQTRGVPFLAPVAQDIKQTDRFEEAVIMKAVMQACFTGFIYSENPDALETNDEKKIQYGKQNYKMEPGALYHLLDNDKVEFANSTAPGGNEVEFIVSKLKRIGMGLNIPFEILLQAFNSSYSASIAARLAMEDVITEKRRWFSSHYNKPIFAEWLGYEILSGEIEAPGFFTDAEAQQAWLGCQWIGSSMGQLDPTKEVGAALMKTNGFLSTLQAETIALNGGDFKKNIRQIKKERALIAGLQQMPLTIVNTTQAGAEQ